MYSTVVWSPQPLSEAAVAVVLRPQSYVLPTRDSARRPSSLSLRQDDGDDCGPAVSDSPRGLASDDRTAIDRRHVAQHADKEDSNDEAAACADSDRRIADAWAQRRQAVAARGGKLFNETKFGLVAVVNRRRPPHSVNKMSPVETPFNASSVEIMEPMRGDDDSVALEMHVGITDYRSHIATNADSTFPLARPHSAAVGTSSLLPSSACSIRAEGADASAETTVSDATATSVGTRAGTSPSLPDNAANALGVESVLISLDGYAVLFRRSPLVAAYAGYYCCPGGHPEPREAVKQYYSSSAPPQHLHSAQGDDDVSTGAPVSSKAADDSDSALREWAFDTSLERPAPLRADAAKKECGRAVAAMAGDMDVPSNALGGAMGFKQGAATDDSRDEASRRCLTSSADECDGVDDVTHARAFHHRLAEWFATRQIDNKSTKMDKQRGGGRRAVGGVVSCTLIVEELFSSALQEVVDEIGVDASTLANKGLVAIVADARGKPDAIFVVHSEQTFDEIAAVFHRRTCKEAFESDGEAGLVGIAVGRRDGPRLEAVSSLDERMGAETATSAPGAIAGIGRDREESPPAASTSSPVVASPSQGRIFGSVAAARHAIRITPASQACLDATSLLRL